MTDDVGEFRLKDHADGTRRWRDSRCAKKARDLAELPDHALRVPQYQMLYRGSGQNKPTGALSRCSTGSSGPSVVGSSRTGP